MHYFIYSDKDSTIYSGSTPHKLASTVVEEQNVGLDSILELDKYTPHTGVNPLINEKSVSRVLVNFDLTSLSSSLVNGDITSPAYNLRLYSTEDTSEIPISYTVFGYPLSSSWEMGIGKKINDPPTLTGVTWNWRDVSGSNYWTTPGADYVSDYSSSQNYTYESADINMEVTTIVNNWLGGDNKISNYGFIVKRSSSLEDNDIEYGSLKFFSRDGHTIYNPKLEVKWRDDSFSTGSLSALDTSNDDYVLYMRNKKSEYKRNSKTKFRVSGRKRIVAKTYSTTSDYLTTSYLPSQSYYSIRDHLTNEEIISFDDYTTISCDSSGNYFNLWMTSFQPDRYYKIAYKIVSGSNESYFDDNKFVFKVVR